jgi:predicted metal-dependent phosphoesterase TrpH
MRKNFLKVDLHTHTAEDPEEPVKHTSFELIDKACNLGYDAISITNHNMITHGKYLRHYARERGVVLIPGVEINIRRKHILVVNADERILKARGFDDLRRLRTPSSMVVAPHPYFPGAASLLWLVRRNIDVFDAIEFSWFYHRLINFNVFAMRTAATYGLPLVCTSDCHHLENFGCAYSLVEAERDAEAIVEAVKAGRVEIAANPLRLLEFGKHGLEHVVGNTVGAVGDLLFGENR